MDENKDLKNGQLFRLFPFVAIMFVSYWATFLLNIFLAVILFLFIQIVKGRKIRASLGFLAASGFILFLVLGACFFERFIFFFSMLRELSSAQAGWSLEYISPISLLGLNTGKNVVFVRQDHLFLLALSIVLFGGLLYFINRNLIRKHPLYHPKIILTGLFSVSWIVYNFSYWYYGADSYNQWKFASFYPMIFSFVISFLFFEKIYSSDSKKWFSMGISGVLLIMAGVTIVYQANSMGLKISQSYQALKKIDNLSEFDTIVVGDLKAHENMVLPNFINKKRLLFTSYSFYSQLKNGIELNPLERAAFLTNKKNNYEKQDLVFEMDNGKDEYFVLLRNPRKYLGWN